MSRITVENIRKMSYDQNPQVKQYYIGRGSAPPYEAIGLGNPFTVEEHGRGKCIPLYAEYLDKQLADTQSREYKIISRLVEELLKGYEIRLFCWCSPHPCHGDVIQDRVMRIYRKRVIDGLAASRSDF